jgi:hypothetical protein
MQLQLIQHPATRRGHSRPAGRRVVAVAVSRSQSGRRQLAKPDADARWGDGTAGFGQPCSQLGEGPGADGAQRIGEAGGGGALWGGGRVGEPGDSAMVGALEVAAGQHGARATRNVPAAARSGEDQRVGGRVGRQLAADRLDDLTGQGDLPDAGRALGRGLEPAAEAAGLTAHVDDLDDGDGPVQAEAAFVEAGELAEAQAGAEQGDDVVPPPQREVGEEQARLVGG